MNENTGQIILGVALLVVIFAIVFPLFFLRITAINNYFCEQSGSARSMISNYLEGFAKDLTIVFASGAYNIVPLVCETNKITNIDMEREDADRLIANEIISCWEKFGKDSKDPIFPRGSFLCSILTFNSTNPNEYVDLMNVYSIVYNRTNLGEYESFEIKNEYSLDFANPFRLCLESNAHSILHNEIENNGLYLAKIEDNQLKAQNDLFSVQADSINKATEMYNHKTAFSCLSFKEGAANMFRMKTSIDTLVQLSESEFCPVEASESLRQICLEYYNFTKRYKNSFAQTEINGEFNSSTKIYSGTFYIRFSDFSYKLYDRFNMDALRGFKELPQTKLYPIDGLLFKDIPRISQHDYVALGYIPDVLSQEIIESDLVSE